MQTAKPARAASYNEGPEGDWLYQKIVSEGVRDPRQLLRERNTWQVVVNVAPQREVLLAHVPIRGRVLEIGAGTGALTGHLLRVADEVVALEPSPQRADTLRARFSGTPHLQVTTQPITDFTARAFDVVVVVGVLEYSGRYIGGASPYADFLATCRRLVADDGMLVLAIENQLGYKYWAGCREDHYAALPPGQGIESYPQYAGVRTFSRNELDRMLAQAGFGRRAFHFPAPDYKLPKEVYAADYYEEQFGGWNETIPTRDLAAPREQTFNEHLLVDTVKRAGLLPDFANSFLVVAQPAPAGAAGAAQPSERVLYTRQDCRKLPERQVRTQILERDGQRIVRKRALQGAFADAAALQQLRSTWPAGSFSLPNVLRDDRAEREVSFAPGRTLAALLFDALLQKDVAGAQNLLKAFRQRAAKLSDTQGQLPYALDLSFGNVICAGSTQTLVDVELLLPRPVALDVLLLRAAVHFSEHLARFISAVVAPADLVQVGDVAVPKLLCSALELDPVTIAAAYQRFAADVLAANADPDARY